jgi:hypothetical protein
MTRASVELFERLLERQNPTDLLKSLRGRIELRKEQKRKLPSEIDRGRKSEGTDTRTSEVYAQ